jgi:hypothetical protein
MTRLNPTGAPPETKFVAQTSYGFLTLVITWIVTNYVFRGHIPADLQTLLPGFVAMVAGAAAGWFSHHTPRLEETISVVRRELAVQAAQNVQQRRSPAPVPQPALPQATAGPTGMAR